MKHFLLGIAIVTILTACVSFFDKDKVKVTAVEVTDSGVKVELEYKTKDGRVIESQTSIPVEVEP